MITTTKSTKVDWARGTPWRQGKDSWLIVTKSTDLDCLGRNGAGGNGPAWVEPFFLHMLDQGVRAIYDVMSRGTRLALPIVVQRRMTWPRAPACAAGGVPLGRPHGRWLVDVRSRLQTAFRSLGPLL